MPGLRLVETLQTVLTAIILAFIYRAFFIEAFVIPTGSMADALLGVHGTHRCPQCGWLFEFGPSRYPEAGDQVEWPENIACPNCHAVMDLAALQLTAKPGDRVLVHKWPHVLRGVLRIRPWDVIVFRDPADTQTNYIKRVVALPGQSVEIVDGDVLIDGEYARKPEAAQQVMWTCVFDQAYAAPDGVRRWISDEPGADSGWSGFETRVLSFRPPDPLPHAVRFPASRGLYMQDIAGYQGSSGTYVGDVRIVAEAWINDLTGRVSFQIARDEDVLEAEIDASGRLRLTRTHAASGWVELLAERIVTSIDPEEPIEIEFAHLDGRVYLRLSGREQLSAARPAYLPDLDFLRSVPRTEPVQVAVIAQSMPLDLRRLRVDRDVYYTFRPGATVRAYAGSPFELGPDEFFVLGDNSPHSHDSREWYRAGVHMPEDYRLGVVRSEQIVGRGFFVYLPSLLWPDGWGLGIPDFGRMRFVR